MPDGSIQVFDRIAVCPRGDVVTAVYGNDARLERTRWLFDRLDDQARGRSGIIVHLIVLPRSGPPDGPTRAENSARLRKLGSSMRRLVTTPLGDSLQVNVVRAVMRGLAILKGRGNHFIANTVREGVQRCREVSSSESPSSQQMMDDVRAIFAEVGEPFSNELDGISPP